MVHCRATKFFRHSIRHVQLCIICIGSVHLSFIAISRSPLFVSFILVIGHLLLCFQRWKVVFELSLVWCCYCGRCAHLLNGGLNSLFKSLVCVTTYISREQTIIGSVSYHNRYWAYRIKSYRLLLYLGKPDITCITADSAAVNRSHYTGRSKDIRVPRAIWSTIRETVGGAGGERL